MIAIFNGKRRALGGSTSDVYAQVAVDFRDVLHQFKGAKLAVFLAIALHADADGWAYPGYDLLCQETGYSRDAVRLALADLCEMEINGHRVLLRFQPPAGGGKQFGSNRYLLFPSAYQVGKYDSAGVQHIGDTGNGFGSRGGKTPPRGNDGFGGGKTPPRYGGGKTPPLTRTMNQNDTNNNKDPEPNDPAVELWQDALQDLRGQMTASMFADWLAPTVAVQLDDDTLTVQAPNERAREWLDVRLRSTVERSVVAIHGERLQVEFTSNGGANE